MGARRWPTVTVVLATATAAGQRSTTLPAAGDIASCASDGDEQTAALLDDTLPGTVLNLGDTVYDDRSADQFGRCYLLSWGRFRDCTPPPAPTSRGLQEADQARAFQAAWEAGWQAGRSAGWKAGSCVPRLRWSSGS